MTRIKTLAQLKVFPFSCLTVRLIQSSTRIRYQPFFFNVLMELLLTLNALQNKLFEESEILSILN